MELGFRLSILLLLASVPFQATGAEDSHQLNSQIGRAIPGRYQSIQDAKDWKNPYLIVGADTITVRSNAFRVAW